MHETLGFSVVAAAWIAAPASASAQEAVHLRGEITKVGAGSVSVKTRANEVYEVALSDTFAVVVYQQIEVSDVDVGDFLSIPSVTSDTGEKVALSINVFPEALRGTGEGESAWDLTEGSLMTNATVGEVLPASDGSVLRVRHGATEEAVLVPEGTPITRFAPDPGRRLEEGDQAVLFVQQGEDGSGVANLAGVSADGSLPPV